MFHLRHLHHQNGDRGGTNNTRVAGKALSCPRYQPSTPLLPPMQARISYTSSCLDIPPPLNTSVFALGVVFPPCLSLSRSTWLFVGNWVCMGSLRAPFLEYGMDLGRVNRGNLDGGRLVHTAQHAHTLSNNISSLTIPRAASLVTHSLISSLLSCKHLIRASNLAFLVSIHNQLASCSVMLHSVRQTKQHSQKEGIDIVDGCLKQPKLAIRVTFSPKTAAHT